MSEQTLEQRLEELVAPLQAELDEIRQRRTALQQEAHTLYQQESKMATAIRAIRRAAGIEEPPEEVHPKRAYRRGRSNATIGAERREQLLKALREAGPAGTTAPDLSRQMGLSGATIYAGLSSLREMGLARLAGTVVARDTGSKRKRFVAVGGGEEESNNGQP